MSPSQAVGIQGRAKGKNQHKPKHNNQIKEDDMKKIDQMPTNGCGCCGKYAELTQCEKRKRLRWSGSEWLCAACHKEEKLLEMREEKLTPDTSRANGNDTVLHTTNPMHSHVVDEAVTTLDDKSAHTGNGFSGAKDSGGQVSYLTDEEFEDLVRETDKVIQNLGEVIDARMDSVFDAIPEFVTALRRVRKERRSSSATNFGQ